jgi:hypothetical protein
MEGAFRKKKKMYQILYKNTNINTIKFFMHGLFYLEYPRAISKTVLNGLNAKFISKFSGWSPKKNSWRHPYS